VRALIVSPYFPPQQAIASLRVHSFARALADRGADVTVLTTHKREDQRGLEGLELRGVRVEEVPYRVPGPLERLRASARPAVGDPAAHSARTRRSAGPLSRLRDRSGVFASVRMPDLTGWWVRPAVDRALALTTEATASKVVPGGWDVVLSSSGPYTAHLAAMAIKQGGLARRWLADFRDLWTANHIFRGLWPLTLVEAGLERRVIAAADQITTVSPPLADWLRVRADALAGPPVEVIWNGHDRDQPAEGPQLAWPPPGQTATAAQQNEPREILYCGSLYPAGQDARPIIVALRMLRDDGSLPPMRLTAVGGSVSAWLGIAGELGERVETDPGQGAAGAVLRVLPAVPRPRLLEMQERAWALLGIEWRDPSAGVVTGKLPEYLAARPMVLTTGAGGVGPMTELAVSVGRGLYLGDEPGSIAARLRRLVGERSGVDGSAGLPERDLGRIRAMHRRVQAGRVADLAERLAAGPEAGQQAERALEDG